MNTEDANNRREGIEQEMQGYEIEVGDGETPETILVSNQIAVQTSGAVRDCVVVKIITAQIVSSLTLTPTEAEELAEALVDLANHSDK
jgi:hypothetical protein